MNDINSLLMLVKDVVRSANILLCKTQEDTFQNFKYLPELPREMKADFDKTLEREILNRLIPVGLPILSEESGEIAGSDKSGLRFIVDPIDGTVNFIRKLGPASISIALYQNNKPILGALGIYPSGDLAWGGKKFGTYLNDKPIHVSTISDKTESVLCTGIPSRLSLDSSESVSEFISRMTPFGKVRMLGSASISLLQVAKGSAELYAEQDIMLWDVAAGLALVEGAGGCISVAPGIHKESLNVVASNGVIY
jgi:myo-inositol-1(or 4)-monophosphatase